jgi:ribosomal protein S18 acetylase RimI-like enzyme
VTLNVRRSNYPAIALYQKALGYEVLKVDVGYYADKEDALYMTKDLS